MITGAEIYWLTRMDGISTAFEVLAFVTGFSMAILFFVSGMVSFDDPSESDKRLGSTLRKVATAALCVFVFSLAGKVLTPTTKEMCAIKIIPAIVNNEDVQELPAEVIGLAREWLDELKPKIDK